MKNGWKKVGPRKWKKGRSTVQIIPVYHKIGKWTEWKLYKNDRFFSSFPRYRDALKWAKRLMK